MSEPLTIHPASYIPTQLGRTLRQPPILLAKPGCTLDELLQCCLADSQRIPTEVEAKEVKAFL